MRIGILGTGTLAVALGTAWTRAGHTITIAGHSPEKAASAASRIGEPTRAVPLPEAVVDQDAVLIAVSWEGLEEVLAAAGAPSGALSGTPLIDPTNAVEHGVGELLTPPGLSVAEQIAGWAPGARVVKAFHLFPAVQWGGSPVTVPLAGDEPAALAVVGDLVRDARGVPAVVGPLRRARQLEEVAGFVIGLAFSGVDPNSAIPRVPGTEHPVQV